MTPKLPLEIIYWWNAGRAGVDAAPYSFALIFHIAKALSVQVGDVANLPFDDNTFDWVWSVDCVGYAPWDTIKILKELLRVVNPGGIVAIAAWSSERLLPGYPRLEARLGATSAGIAPFAQGRDPSLHFNRGLGWFRQLGLEDIRAQAFAGSSRGV